MALQNVSLDDFSPMISYSPYLATNGSWYTNNANADQTWGNTSYFQGTWHQTQVQGASFTIATNMQAFSIYGQLGPTFGSYSLSVDGQVVANGSAYAASNQYGALYYASGNLTRGSHNVTMTNLGAKQANEGNALLLDVIQLSTVVGAEGATLQNQTINQNSTQISYSEPWTVNYNPLFIDGDTAYTNTNSSATLRFNGSAVYIIGDHLNDHGLFTVTLDGQNTTLQAFVPTPDYKISVKYYASDLNGSEHTLIIANDATTVPASFFDLDAIIVTQPSAYLNASSSPASPSGTALVAAASPTSSISAASGLAARTDTWLFALLAIFCSLLMRRRS